MLGVGAPKSAHAGSLEVLLSGGVLSPNGSNGAAAAGAVGLVTDLCDGVQGTQ